MVGGAILLFAARNFPKPSAKTPPFFSVTTERISPSVTALPSTPTPRATLKSTVEVLLEDRDGTYGIAIKQLQTGESYFLHEHRRFAAGSLYKSWVLVTAFEQIQQGKLKEAERLSQDVAILNSKFNIASESAERTEGTVTYTVKDAMEQMITVSHNYAALLLSERVTLRAVSQYLKNHGLSESNLGEPPQTTAYDSALFFEKLYNGELANAENTKKMIGVLKRQKLNNKLPKLLPQGTEVAHKTGEIDTFSHDAGIVYTKKRDYVIAVLTESDKLVDAEEKIAEISKAVYEYFTL